MFPAVNGRGAGSIVRLLIVPLALIIAVAIGHIQAQQYLQGQPCEGLGGYFVSYVEAQDAFIQFVRESGLAGREGALFSTSEWQDLAEQAAGWQTKLKAISPHLVLALGM